jgi:hypothetical protein
VRQDVVNFASQAGSFGENYGLCLGILRGPQLRQELLGAVLGGAGPGLRHARRPGKHADREQEGRRDVVAAEVRDGQLRGGKRGDVGGGGPRCRPTAMYQLMPPRPTSSAAAVTAITGGDWLGMSWTALMMMSAKRMRHAAIPVRRSAGEYGETSATDSPAMRSA